MVGAVELFVVVGDVEVVELFVETDEVLGVDRAGVDVWVVDELGGVVVDAGVADPDAVTAGLTDSDPDGETARLERRS